jgi:hypothetical protein
VRAPIHPLLFRRLLFDARTAGSWLGFSVRFPGRTPDDAKRWLRAHGYAFKGRSWNRTDRKPTRMGYMQRAEHTHRMRERRKRRLSRNSE